MLKYSNCIIVEVVRVKLRDGEFYLIKWEKIKENKRMYFVKRKNIAGRRLIIRAFTEEGKNKYFLLNFSITPFPHEYLKQIMKEVKKYFDVHYSLKDHSVDFWILKPYNIQFNSLKEIEEKVLKCLRPLYFEYIVPTLAREKILYFLRQRGWITSLKGEMVSAIKIVRQNKNLIPIKLKLILLNKELKVELNATFLTFNTRGLKILLRSLSRKYKVFQNEVILTCTTSILNFEDIIITLEEDINRALKVLTS